MPCFLFARHGLELDSRYTYKNILRYGKFIAFIRIIIGYNVSSASAKLARYFKDKYIRATSTSELITPFPARDAFSYIATSNRVTLISAHHNLSDLKTTKSQWGC